LLYPFRGERAWSSSNTMRPRPSGILIYPAVWLQWTWAENGGGVLCPFLGELDSSSPKKGHSTGSPSNTTWPQPRPTSVSSGILIHPAVWPQQTWAENCGGCAPLGGWAGSPSNTMWSGTRPTSITSGILIHLALWPHMGQKVGVLYSF